MCRQITEHGEHVMIAPHDSEPLVLNGEYFCFESLSSFFLLKCDMSGCLLATGSKVCAELYQRISMLLVSKSPLKQKFLEY